jgi:peptidoglycan hydrolase-like protein with peptidoglycan-binding domain
MTQLTVDMRTLDLQNASEQPVTGRHVRNLQGLLNVWLRSFDEEPIPLLELDGVAGGKTAGITVRFQEAHGLGADAVVGPHTWTNLIKQSEEPVAL